MKLRLASLALLVALFGAFVVAPLGASAAPKTSGGTATIQTIAGTVTNLTATFDRTTGLTTITGTFTDAVTGIVTNFTTTLLGASGSCTILHLVLGPLDLNVLGLMVHLDRVVLDITAQAGPGNLLGNLLCAVAHLLDGSASGNALTNLLNTLFGLLG